MGRLLCTNDMEWREKLRKCFKENGLVENYSGECLTVYKKKYVDNENYYVKGDNAVYCVGTWAYEDCVQKEALHKLYVDAIENSLSVENIRKKFMGTYCCIIQKGKNVKVFVDETHTYAMYYYISEGKYILSNTYYHIQKMAKQEIDKDTFRYVIAISGLCCNKTPFKNIYRLWEDEYLEIEDNVAAIKKCKLNNQKYSFSSFEEATEQLNKIISNKAEVLNKNSNKKLLFATGGLDSRLKLALDQRLEKNVTLAYWGGDNVITNGTISDRKVNEQIAEKYKLDTHFFDVSEDFDYSMSNIKKCIDFLGEKGCEYAYNSKWLDIVNKIHKIDADVDEIELGFDPDILRELGNEKECYNIDEMIETFYLRTEVYKHVFEEDDISDVIKTEVTNSKISDSLDMQNMTMREAANLFNYNRLDMGSKRINFFNEYYFCCNLLYTKEIWDMVNCVPYEYRENSRLSIALISRWKKDLLEVPVFSHGHYMVVDNKKLCLKRTKKHAFLSWLKPKVINTKIYDLIYIKFLEKKIFPESKTNSTLMMECMKWLEKENWVNKYGLIMQTEIKESTLHLADCAGTLAYIELIRIAANEKR